MIENPRYVHTNLVARGPTTSELRLYVEQENHAAQATYAGGGMRRTRYLLMQHLFGEHA